MSKSQSTNAKTAETLTRIATELPDSEIGVACQGTSLESTTVNIRGKAFLFVRAMEARLKLTTSRAEAQTLATKDPAHYSVAANGWVLIRFGETGSLPLKTMKTWIEESYHAMSAKKASTKAVKPAPSALAKKTKKPGKNQS